MTTTVRIEAHCDDETEVRVMVSGEPERILHSGEATDVHVYGDCTTVVQEIPKT